jgi:hypothetical protein
MPNVIQKIVNANQVKNGSTIASVNQFGTRQIIAGEVEVNAVTDINNILGDKAVTVLSPAPTQFYFKVRKSNSAAAQGYINIGANGQGNSGDVSMSVFPFHPNDSQSLAGLEDIFDIGGYLFIQSKARPGVYVMFNTDASGASVSGGAMSITGTYNTSNGVFNDDEVVIVSFDAAGSGGGGNPFNQDLNTDDNVIFNTVEVSNIKNIEGTNIIGWDNDNNIIIYQFDGITPLFSTNTSNNPILAGLTYPNADGMDGYVLRTNGAGVISFQHPNSFDQSLDMADSPTFAGLYTGSINNTGDNSLAVDVGNRGLIATDGTTKLINFSNTSTDGAYYFNAGVLVGDGSQLTGINPFDQTLNQADSPTFSAIYITTLYDLNNSLGTAGQFLSSDGASAVWADAIDSSPSIPDPTLTGAGYAMLGYDGAGIYSWNLAENVSLSIFSNDIINQGVNTGDDVTFNSITIGASAFTVNNYGAVYCADAVTAYSFTATANVDAVALNTTTLTIGSISINDESGTALVVSSNVTATSFQTEGGISADGDLTCYSLAVFGAIPPSFPPTYNILVDSTGGSGSGTFELVNVDNTGVADPALVNNNFATLQDRIEELQNVLISYGLAAVSA